MLEILRNLNKIYFDNYSFVKILKDNVFIVKDNYANTLYIQKTIPESECDINIFHYFHNKTIPHIPNIIDIKRLDDDSFAIIKEYIDGEVLIDYLNNNQTIPTNFFYDVMYKLCDTINYFHNLPCPIIYRDIKPSNIMIYNADLYLIDLDSMVFYDPTKEEDTRKKGTEGFAAPEQYGFASSSPATDIYTIGSLIKFMLPYFNNKSLDKKMTPIIDKCCKMDSKDRYKNATELKHDIYISEKNYRLLSIPGFRKGNYIHMLCATLFYILIAYYCFFSPHYYPFKLNILTFIFILLVTLVSLNYLGIYRLMPLTKSKHIVIKMIGIVVLVLIVTILLFIICTILNYIL